VVAATTSSAAGTAAPKATPLATGFGVAPYVDMTNNQEPMLNAAISSGGLKAFTAAFVIGSGCTAIWGDTLPITNDPTVSGDISSAQSAGAQVIVSFGGAGGVELAQSCTNTASLQAAYQSVINQYHLTHVDFDVEGAAIADPTSINRRFAAIKGLESANSGLIVSMTVPVLPSGLDGNGTAFVADAKADGARVDIWNVMAMDYGGGSDPANMGQDAINAAQGTLNQVRAQFPSDTMANIGITPMIGVNDDSAENFSEANASSVVSFANSNGVGRLAFWSIDRDQPCAGSATGLPACSEISQAKLDFTKIFDGFSGGGNPPPPPTTTKNPPPPTTTTKAPPTTTQGGGGGCAGLTAWNVNTSYVPNDLVSFGGHKWTSLYWSTGVTPGSPIAWNIWQDNGAC
jgi:chitinase